MKVGDLVRHKDFPDHMGIIVETGFRDIHVAWMDGDKSWVYKRQMEVICK